MADENRIVTFEYANENFNSYRRPDVVEGQTTKECMTKTDFLTIYEGDDSLLIDYQGNQLVPRSRCKSGYKCNEAYIRTKTYHSSEITHTFKISVKGTGVFPVFINMSPYRNFSAIVYDSLGNIVKTVNQVNFQAAVFKVPKTTNTLEEFKVVVINKSNPLYTVPTYTSYHYSFGCAISNSQVGMLFPNKLYIKENGYPVSTVVFVLNTHPGNYPDVHFDNSNNPLQFTNTKLSSIIHNSNENVGYYQAVASTNGYGAPAGTVFNNYKFTFLGKTVDFSVQYVSSSWSESN